MWTTLPVWSCLLIVHIERLLVTVSRLFKEVSTRDTDVSDQKGIRCKTAEMEPSM